MCVHVHVCVCVCVCVCVHQHVYVCGYVCACLVFNFAATSRLVTHHYMLQPNVVMFL